MKVSALTILLSVGAALAAPTANLASGDWETALKTALEQLDPPSTLNARDVAAEAATAGWWSKVKKWVKEHPTVIPTIISTIGRRDESIELPKVDPSKIDIVKQFKEYLIKIGFPAAELEKLEKLFSGIPVGIPTGVPTGLPVGIPTGVPTGLPIVVPTGLPGIPKLNPPKLIPRDEAIDPTAVDPTKLDTSKAVDTTKATATDIAKFDPSKLGFANIIKSYLNFLKEIGIPTFNFPQLGARDEAANPIDYYRSLFSKAGIPVEGLTDTQITELWKKFGFLFGLIPSNLGPRDESIAPAPGVQDLTDKATGGVKDLPIEVPDIPVNFADWIKKVTPFIPAPVDGIKGVPSTPGLPTVADPIKPVKGAVDEAIGSAKDIPAKVGTTA